MRVLRISILTAAMLYTAAASAQVSSSGTINATLINRGGIALLFHTDAGGVTLGNNGSSTASANFGSISAFGALAPGVTRPVVGPASYSVRTIFDVFVSKGALPFSANYTLSASLAAAAPTGINYAIDGTVLTTASQTLATAAAYNADVPHSLDLVVSTAAPGAGGPVVGTPITATINFTATSN